MTQAVLEWAPFHVREGVAQPQLQEAAGRLERDFLARQPGFIRRELVRQGPGTYVDLVWWRSREHAEAAMRNARESTACSDYFALMRDATGECFFYDTVLGPSA